ncbi:MAG: DoxX family protein [Patescibacteria group bacterium]
MNTTRFSSAWKADLGILILRVGLGVTFLVHGIAKLSGMEGTIGFFGSLGLHSSLAWAVALIETIGGAMLILGVWTMVPALLLVAVMIGAIITTKIGKPFMGGYELDFVLLMSLLAAATLGSGKYALTKGSSCDSCGACGCNCHEGDKRCGVDGKCEGCTCA